MSLKAPPKPVRLTLAAGAERNIDGPGTFLRVDAATGPFQLGFDLGPPFDSGLGRWYRADPGTSFNRVTVANPGVSAVSVTLLIQNETTSGDDSLKVDGNQVGSLAQDGVDGVGILPPAGAVGIRGWLSGIYNALSGGVININTTGMSTEATLAALKARADLLGTEATLAALKARGDLLGTEATLAALKASADLLATDAKAEAIRALLAGVLTVRDNPETLSSLPDVVCGAGVQTKVIDSVATPHKTVTVYNAGTVAIRVGPLATAAGEGLPIAPSASVTLRTSDSVYVFNPGAAFNAPIIYTA